MKVKIVLGIVALLGIGVGTYIYQNRYSFYRYLPAENENKLQSINFKLCDENGNLFSGRVKSRSDLYLNIYSYKDGELNGLNVIYYKESLQDGEWKFYLKNGNLQTIANYKSGELNGLKEDYYENGKLWTRQEFKDNIPEDIYEIYYEDGTPQLKAKIKEGIVIEEKRFNRDGTLYDEDDDRVIISESVDNNFDDISFSENKEEITITEIDEAEIIRTN